MIRVLGVSFVLLRLWMDSWMGTGHQEDQAMVRLEFSCPLFNLQRVMRDWKWN